MPTAEQDALLMAAGFAPSSHFSLTQPLAPRDVNAEEYRVARDAAARVLESHEPFPAIAINLDRDVVLGNRAATALLQGVAPSLRTPPINIYKVLLHPEGFAPRIVDFPLYSCHLLSRLQRDAELSGSTKLKMLFTEAKTYPHFQLPLARAVNYEEVLFLRIREPAGELSFFSALTTFSTPLDLVTTELVVEALFPTDQFTANHLHKLAAVSNALI